MDTTLNLIKQLDRSLQNKILYYYFGLGTDTAVILRPLIRRLSKVPHYNHPDMTLWRRLTPLRGCQQITASIGSMFGMIAKYELQSAYCDSPICFHPNKDMHSFNARLIVGFTFIHKYQSLHHPYLHGTPTAMIIKQKNKAPK